MAVEWAVKGKVLGGRGGKCSGSNLVSWRTASRLGTWEAAEGGLRRGGAH